MTAPKCFTCKTRPAGNDYAGPFSAYCGECQPRDTRPQPTGSQCACGACDRIFATLTDFDRHQERHPRGHAQEGVFTGRCFDPASVGLELSGQVWGTPAGNANRVRKAAALAASRRNLTPVPAPAGIPGTPSAADVPDFESPRRLALSESTA